MVDSLGGYLNNIFGTVTNKGSIFEQYSKNFTKLANSIVTLTDTNKNQQAELRALREDNANLKKNVVTPDADGGQRQDIPSNPEFPRCGPKQYWVRGAYCWSHGFVIGKIHDGGNSCNKNTGQQVVYTWENTMGGTQSNKEWES